MKIRAAIVFTIGIILVLSFLIRTKRQELNRMAKVWIRRTSDWDFTPYVHRRVEHVRKKREAQFSSLW
ncbi:hypothetical protein [Pseudalkalibacillus sp. NRS-1564]|uniref:hypothetical protein n=1 Tax=Pseudalkalibacillus sp. NRS-1564 TaxID=3233900 RepID=UPI003D2C782A